MRNRHTKRSPIYVNRQINLLTPLVFALAVLFAFPGYATADEKNPHAVVFVDADDNPQTLEKLIGEVVLVNIWATWCSPCVEEMPELNKLQQDFAERGLKVITISEDFRRDKAIEFLEDNDLDALPRYFDVASALLRSYGVSGLPLSILYDTEGKEVERFTGAVKWSDEEVRKKIEALLTTKTPEEHNTDMPPADDKSSPDPSGKDSPPEQI